MFSICAAFGLVPSRMRRQHEMAVRYCRSREPPWKRSGVLVLVVPPRVWIRDVARRVTSTGLPSSRSRTPDNRSGPYPTLEYTALLQTFSSFSVFIPVSLCRWWRTTTSMRIAPKRAHAEDEKSAGDGELWRAPRICRVKEPPDLEICRLIYSHELTGHRPGNKGTHDISLPVNRKWSIYNENDFAKRQNMG